MNPSAGIPPASPPSTSPPSAALRSWRRIRGLRIALPRADDVLWLLGYALAFGLAHRVAFIWGRQGYYSVLYPAAGVRFALLWHRGPRLTVAVALVEVAVQTLTGIVRPGADDWVTAAVLIFTES